jgi:hypothetical protein
MKQCMVSDGGLHGLAAQGHFSFMWHGCTRYGGVDYDAVGKLGQRVKKKSTLACKVRQQSYGSAGGEAAAGMIGLCSCMQRSAMLLAMLH